VDSATFARDAASDARHRPYDNTTTTAVARPVNPSAARVEVARARHDLGVGVEKDDPEK
jgi:hypothetical protein